MSALISIPLISHTSDCEEYDQETKTDSKLLTGSRNITFQEAQTAIEAFGFHLTRIKGSHHIYTHPSVPELINLQNVDGKAKSYQIKQFLEIVERYNLLLEDDT
jgi:predicted RNA binding protein YcfA (HicA-like mRNA interferase family)